MTPRPRGARPAVATGLRAFLVAALLTGLGLAGWSPASATAAGARPGAAVQADATALPITISIDAVAPQVLQPGQDLAVTVTVTNTGTTPVAEPRVSVLLDPDQFVSRSALDAWRDAAPLDDAGGAVLDLDLPAPLAPGQQLVVPAVVPAAAVPFRDRPATWGPRGLAVRVVDRADPARRTIGLARSFALWFPEQEVTATRVSMLAPVVGPEVDPGSPTWVAELDRLTRPGGRLATLLAATGEHPELTWVVDPWLLEVTSGDGGTPDDAAEPGPPDAAAGPAATAWSRQLVEAMTDRDVRLLPYGDADVVALAHAGASDALAAAVERGRQVALATDLPDTAGATIAWPTVPLPDLITAGFVSEPGDRSLVVGPGELLASSDLTYTPGGRTTVTTPSGDVTVLVPDERLSTALATGWVTGTAPAPAEGEDAGEAEEPDAEDLAAPTAPTILTGAVAAQDVLAELAVITRERPAEARHLLMTVPRDWEPDAAVVGAQLDALSAAPWVHLEPVAALVGGPDGGEARSDLPARAVEGTEITPSEVAALSSAVADRAAVARMVQDPSSLVADLEVELLAPLSVAWRDDPARRARMIADSVAATQALRDAVTVEPGPTLNVLSRTGQFPVQITNSLDQPVTVTVSLDPNSRRLVADEEVTVTVPPDGTESALIPVHAVQRADVVVGIELRTADGVLIDRIEREVRVRADWEGIGMTILGALLAVGLVVGLVRSIRRGRSTRRSAPVDVGPDALSPEEAAANTADQADGAPSEQSDPSDPSDPAAPAPPDAGARQVQR